MAFNTFQGALLEPLTVKVNFVFTIYVVELFIYTSFYPRLFMEDLSAIFYGGQNKINSFLILLFHAVYNLEYIYIYAVYKSVLRPNKV